MDVLETLASSLVRLLAGGSLPTGRALGTALDVSSVPSDSVGRRPWRLLVTVLLGFGMATPLTASDLRPEEFILASRPGLLLGRRHCIQQPGEPPPPPRFPV